MSLLARDQTQNIVGYASDPYNNEARRYDDHGQLVPLTQNPLFKAPIFLLIEARTRNTTLYPNATSFTIQLPRIIQGVSSIELVHATIPNAAVAPANNYFFITNGQVKGSVPGSDLGGVFTIPGSASTDLVPSNVLSAGGNAFALLPYDSAATQQVFTRINWNRVIYYQPEKNSVSQIHVSLVDSTGIAYVFGANTNWTCTLMITARI